MSGCAALQTKSDYLETNLAAIEARSSEMAARLRAADPPETLRFVTGRDGHPTYQWREADGTLRWLGRTSMPTVSGPALIDAFQPGSANVLFYSLGSGLEAKALLGRLGPYQSIFVVEPNVWAASLALRLHDYAEEIRAGRFVLFAGDRAWEEMREFVCENPGYLEPQRILSWPWFTPETIGEVTSRLGEVNSALTVGRGKCAGEIGGGTDGRKGVAIISNVVDDEVFRTARLIEMAARELGWRTLRVTLDRPDMVHPEVVAPALKSFRPDISLLVGCVPGGLAFGLPECRVISLAMQRQRPNAEWVRLLGRDATLLIADEKDRTAWMTAGIDAGRIDVAPPAAQAGLPRRTEGGCSRIIVHADGGDVSAKAVGLHLSSHCRLYDEVGHIIQAKAGTYIDDEAADVLATAEKRAGIQIESEGVRVGLVKRIREQLGPVVVRREVLKKLLQSGVGFDLFGSGWGKDSEIGSHTRGRYPAPERLGDVINEFGVTVWIATSEEIAQPVLDALAAGHVVILRKHPGNRGYEQYGKFGTMFREFSSPDDLVKLLRQIRTHERGSGDDSADRAERMRAEHTWVQRLRGILGAAAHSWS